MLPVRVGLWPIPPSRIIKEVEEHAVVDDGIGGIYVSYKKGSTPSYYIRCPIRSRNDWERLKPFFNPNTPGRIPLNWDEVVESYKDRSYPLGIGSFSLYGWLRNWMGIQGLSIAFYRDTDWVCEMMDTLVELWVKLIRKVLKDIKVDFATWWEDMCYNRGPMISPRIFEEFIVPRYKRVTDTLREYGGQ
ncbi:MAG: uroporphyrinogen decarboxylase family protein [Candidatus Bathyarchaeia archaeon]